MGYSLDLGHFLSGFQLMSKTPRSRSPLGASCLKAPGVKSIALPVLSSS